MKKDKINGKNKIEPEVVPDDFSGDKLNIIKLGLFVFLAFCIVSYQKENGTLFPQKESTIDAPGLPSLSLPDGALRAQASVGCGHEQKAAPEKGAIDLSSFIMKKNIESIIQDKPMRAMTEAVAKRDAETASYLVAIAKKESNLGKISPKDETGKDCYNYWGFRGSQNTLPSGYSCFDTPEEAVRVVGDRINYLAKVGNFDTPAKMAVWKCGFDCSWDNKVAVRKWIADVDMYYNKVKNF